MADQEPWIVIEINHHRNEVTHPFGPFECPDEAKHWVAEEGVNFCRYEIKKLYQPSAPEGYETWTEYITCDAEEDPAWLRDYDRPGHAKETDND